MVNQRPFGRRSSPQWQPLSEGPKLDLPAPEIKSVIADPPSGQSSLFHTEAIFPRVKEPLMERKPAIERRFKMPWRQLSLMASLCFGVASFVLPDSLNDELNWLLYGLMAISAYAGFSKRFLQS
jgi:hypothetical protein